MLNIEIKTIPHGEQAYETVGNYWQEGEKFVITVSDMGNWRKELCVAVHELIESHLCIHREISNEQITAFDIAFEHKRQPGNIDEPGDHPEAPYRQEHVYATNVEKLLASELGLDWDEYSQTVWNLSKEKK